MKASLVIRGTMQHVLCIKCKKIINVGKVYIKLARATKFKDPFHCKECGRSSKLMEIE